MYHQGREIEGSIGLNSSEDGKRKTPKGSENAEVKKPSSDRFGFLERGILSPGHITKYSLSYRLDGGIYVSALDGRGGFDYLVALLEGGKGKRSFQLPQKRKKQTHWMKESPS